MRQPLIELHGALVKLHKALLDSERQVYEKDVGRIQSPNHFFQLLTSDPFFSWLRPISQLIVAIDETLDAKELTHADVDAVMTSPCSRRRFAVSNPHLVFLYNGSTWGQTSILSIWTRIAGTTSMDCKLS